MKHLICLLASSLMCMPLVAEDHFTSARETATTETVARQHLVEEKAFFEKTP